MTRYFNCYSARAQWQALNSITGLDPNKQYYMKIIAYNRKPIIVDGYVGFRA